MAKKKATSTKSISSLTASDALKQSTSTTSTNKSIDQHTRASRRRHQHHTRSIGKTLDKSIGKSVAPTQRSTNDDDWLRPIVTSRNFPLLYHCHFFLLASPTVSYPSRFIENVLFLTILANTSMHPARRCSDCPYWVRKNSRVWALMWGNTSPEPRLMWNPKHAV